MGSGRNLAGTAEVGTAGTPWAWIGAAAFASGALIAAVAIPGIRATTTASGATAVDEGIARGIWPRFRWRSGCTRATTGHAPDAAGAQIVIGEQDSMLRFSVTDDGPGFRKERASRGRSR